MVLGKAALTSREPICFPDAGACGAHADSLARYSRYAAHAAKFGGGFETHGNRVHGFIRFAISYIAGAGVDFPSCFGFGLHRRSARGIARRVLVLRRHSHFDNVYHHGDSVCSASLEMSELEGLSRKSR